MFFRLEICVFTGNGFVIYFVHFLKQTESFSIPKTNLSNQFFLKESKYYAQYALKNDFGYRPLCNYYNISLEKNQI